MPRAVLDPNVLISALISPAGPSARLLLELRAGAFDESIHLEDPEPSPEPLGDDPDDEYLIAPARVAGAEVLVLEALTQ